MNINPRTDYILMMGDNGGYPYKSEEGYAADISEAKGYSKNEVMKAYCNLRHPDGHKIIRRTSIFTEVVVDLNEPERIYPEDQ